MCHLEQCSCCRLQSWILNTTYLVHVKKKIAMAIRACLQESFVLREESHIPRINSSQYLVIFLLLKLHGFGVGMGSCQSKSTRMNWHSSIQCNKRAFSIGTEDQCKGAESWKNLLLGGISLHKMSQVRYMYQYLPSMQVPEVNVKVYIFFSSWDDFHHRTNSSQFSCKWNNATMVE